MWKNCMKIHYEQYISICMLNHKYISPAWTLKLWPQNVSQIPSFVAWMTKLSPITSYIHKKIGNRGLLRDFRGIILNRWGREDDQTSIDIFSSYYSFLFIFSTFCCRICLRQTMCLLNVGNNLFICYTDPGYTNMCSIVCIICTTVYIYARKKFIPRGEAETNA